MMKPSDDQLREQVRRKYAELAGSARAAGAASCCGSADAPQEVSNLIGDAYEGVAGYVADADLGLGCGVPVESAGLRPGQTVLDLGSGAGLDVFVARREVGEGGRVIGVDMTPEMIARARDNARQSGFENVEFRLGEIEHLPVESGSIDVVISNCVLNLVPDKGRAFSEIFRVLKPGGHFCISDVVASGRLPDWLASVAEAYAGCVAGALPQREYLQIIEAAGFDSVEVVSERAIEVPDELLRKTLSPDQRAELSRLNLRLMSITLNGRKPA
jgi:SAM-dependent methyltransferase